MAVQMGQAAVQADAKPMYNLAVVRPIKEIPGLCNPPFTGRPCRHPLP